MNFKDELATLNIHIDSTSKQPIYLQLATQIRQLMQNKRLLANNQLPSSRKLALMLNISRTSTLNAYDQLIAEGLLITRPNAGVFVTDLPVLKLSPRLNSSAEKVKARKNTTSITLADSGFFDAGPDTQLFPAAEWARSLSKVWRNPSPELLRDFPSAGFLPLREAVVRYLKVARNIDCATQQVFITAGSPDAVSLIADALSINGEQVAIEDPCYPLLRHGLEKFGAQLQHCPVDQQGMSLARAKVKLAWMSAARQYPLGFAMTMQRRLEWLEYSDNQQSYIVEDDYDAEFHYQKTPLSPLYSLSAMRYPSATQRVIYTGSFSKILFRTLRIGFMVVPKSLIDTFLQTQLRRGNLASLPLQPAVAEFISHRRFASHLRRMRRCYHQRRDFLHALLQEQLVDYLQVELPESGMNLLARFKQPSSNTQEDTQIAQRLAKVGIQAPALSPHYQTKPQQGLLLGFSGASERQLTKGVTQIADILKQK